jgi:hypothetical protein
MSNSFHGCCAAHAVAVQIAAKTITDLEIRRTPRMARADQNPSNKNLAQIYALNVTAIRT